MDSSKHLGAVAALSAGIIWGFLGVFVREMTSAGFTPMQMTCLRYVIVFLILALYLGMTRRDELRINRGAILLMAIIGVVGNALNSTCYFSAMERISLSLSTILQYFAPFIVVLASVPLFHERITKTKVAAILLAFCGCIGCTGIISDPGSMDLLGIAFGSLSAVFFTAYTVGSKKASTEGYSPSTILFYASLFCAVSLSPFCDLPAAAGTTFSSFGNLLLLVGLGVVMTLLPFGLYNYSLKKIEAGKAAIITYIEPLTATIVGLAFYSEAVHADTVVGIALVLAALVIINRNPRDARKPIPYKP